MLHFKWTITGRIPPYRKWKVTGHISPNLNGLAPETRAFVDSLNEDAKQRELEVRFTATANRIEVASPRAGHIEQGRCSLLMRDCLGRGEFCFKSEGAWLRTTE